MRVGVYNTTTGGAARYRPGTNRYDDVELIDFPCAPSIENLHLLKEHGCEAILYFADNQEDDAFYQTLRGNGVRYICTNSTGYDFLNLKAMKAHGLNGANIPSYSPNAMAEHALMLLLGVLRQYREQTLRIANNNYCVKGIMGSEIRNQNIGVVGAGRIGFTTLQCLSGFYPKGLYAYDLFQNDKVKRYAEYVSLDKLYAVCDVIIFHCSLNEDNYHMVNTNSIAKMRDGVKLINMARGGLFDLKAVLEGVKSGKIGGIGLDVVEDEALLETAEIGGVCPDPVLRELLSLKNVEFTFHTASFTDQAEREKIEIVAENLHSYAAGLSCKNELVK